MDENELEYRVVVNHEEQYSIWPAERENPPGWRDGGMAGTKTACLEYIKTVWTDMRPLSLRKRMEELANNPQPFEEEEEDTTAPLVDRLSAGSHRVEVTIRPERTLDALKECVARDYVHLKFTETRGGTELGVQLDRSACSLEALESGNGTRSIHLEGTLTLDYVPVRCVADIDLDTMAGEGHLVKETVEAVS